MGWENGMLLPVFRREDDFMLSLNGFRRGSAVFAGGRASAARRSANRVLSKKMCALTLVLALCAVPMALAASIAVVTNAQAPVYRSTTSLSSVLVPEGVVMRLTSYADGWGKVTSKGKTAYIEMKYLNLQKPIQVYLSKDATLYADTGSEDIGTLSKGTAVSFLGMEGDYGHISDETDSIEGYVTLDALTRTPDGVALMATAASAESSDIERAIYEAQKLIDTPYAIVSDPPTSFNCASFVYYCYNQADSGSISKSLSEQVHDDGHEKISSIEELRRGDLVCFNIDGRNDPYGHVGIYLGDGYFIHASSSDEKVTVSSLASGYYQSAFSWGRRILEA